MWFRENNSKDGHIRQMAKKNYLGARKSMWSVGEKIFKILV